MKETKIKNVGFENIAITDGFWKEKQDLFRDVTLEQFISVSKKPDGLRH